MHSVFFPLINNVFSKPKVLEMQDLLRRLIERSQDDSVRTQIIIAEVFTKSHAIKLQAHLRQIIKTANQNILSHIAYRAFAGQDLSRMKETLRLFVEKAEPAALRQLVQSAGPSLRKHLVEVKDVVALIMEKGDAQIERELSYNVLRYSEALQTMGLLHRHIAKLRGKTLYQFGVDILETGNDSMDQVLRPVFVKLLRDGEEDALVQLSRFSFGAGKIAARTDLLSLLLKYASEETLAPFHEILQRTPEHVAQRIPEWPIFVGALDIPDPATRRAWMNAELLKMNSPLAPARARGRACLQVWAP